MKQILGDYIRLEDTMFSIETQNNSILFCTCTLTSKPLDNNI